MNLLAITGSYREGRTIDTLVDRAIEGAKANGEVHVDRVALRDLRIEYCKNCMTCRNDDPSKPYARCALSDDMDALYPLIDKADRFIFGTPVNIGQVTAVTKTFLERICWVFSRPGRWPLAGCPTPRSDKEKRAIIIVSSGIVPPLLRRFCDDATSLISCVCGSCLNARVVGSVYAGAVEKRGVERYLGKAYALGRKLTS